MGQKVAVVGQSSGLAKYLRQYQSFVFGDSDVEFVDSRKKPCASFYDMIVFCAHIHDIEDPAQYISENMRLLQEWLEVSHWKFIYFSSIDVLPKEHSKEGLEYPIPSNKIESLYGLAKNECEKLVRGLADTHLILRPSMIANPFGKPNTIENIRYKTPIRISRESEINLVAVSSIGKCIRKHIIDELMGTFTVASSYNTTVNSLLKKFRVEPLATGSYTYRTPKITKNPLTEFEPSLKLSSDGVAANYIQFGVY